MFKFDKAFLRRAIVSTYAASNNPVIIVDFDYQRQYQAYQYSLSNAYPYKQIQSGFTDVEKCLAYKLVHNKAGDLTILVVNNKFNQQKILINKLPLIGSEK